MVLRGAATRAMAGGSSAGGPWVPAVIVRSEVQARSLVASLGCLGWAAVDLADLPDRPWSLAGGRWLTSAVPNDEATARDLVRTFLRGVAVVVVDGGPVRDRLVADLERIGPVIDLTSEPIDPIDELEPAQCTLLHALSEGRSVAEA